MRNALATPPPLKVLGDTAGLLFMAAEGALAIAVFTVILVGTAAGFLVKGLGK